MNSALPVRECSADAPLDAIIPFSSVILLGVVVAVEDRYGFRITREQLARASESGATLRHLADMIEEALSKESTSTSASPPELASKRGSAPR